MKPPKLIKESQFWLLAIAAGLITLSLTITMKSEFSDELLDTTFLFWVAVAFLLWKKRHTLNLHSDIFSSFLGVSLIALVLFKSLSGYIDDSFLRVDPILSFLGFALLASGVKKLNQYWQELLLLGFLVIPQYWLSHLTDLSIITAKFAAFMLHYLGFAVKSDGIKLLLKTGYVEVHPGCSGAETIFQLVGLSLIFLVMFPPKKHKIIIVPFVAVILGFLINGLRVVLMAILHASSKTNAFNYWHQGHGSLIFSLLSVVVFGLFYQYFCSTLPKEIIKDKGV